MTLDHVLLIFRKEARDQLRDRRTLLAIQEGVNEGMIKMKCPSVFTLVPSSGFTLLDTWFGHATKDQELDLTLYCEHEKQWHAIPESGTYRFRPDQTWFDSLKKNWKQLAAITKRVAPLAGVAGASAIAVVATGIGKIEKVVGEFSRVPTGPLAAALETTQEAGEIELDTRFLLERLVEYLDTTRDATQPHKGGLFPYQLKEDGRLLWLCPTHRQQYDTARSRG